ncbi:MAG: translation elongation factor-like protein [Candidatus Kaelpia imicola]|nr:translation elongation factor-like protein [Candidatus Kaelpia imicola]
MALFGIFKSKSEKAKKVAIKTTKKKTISKKKVESTKPAKKVKPKEIGRITHYFGKISVGIIKLKAPLEVGTKIHIKGANDDFKQTVKSMQSYHQSVTKAKKGEEVGIKVSKKVHENDKVYMVE